MKYRILNNGRMMGSSCFFVLFMNCNFHSNIGYMEPDTKDKSLEKESTNSAKEVKFVNTKMEKLQLKKEQVEEDKKIKQEEGVQQILQYISEIFDSLKLLKEKAGIELQETRLSTEVFFEILSREGKMLKKFSHPGGVWEKLSIGNSKEEVDNYQCSFLNNLFGTIIHEEYDVKSGDLNISSIAINFGLDLNLSYEDIEKGDILRYYMKNGKKYNKLSFLDRFGFDSKNPMNIKKVIEQGSKALDKEENRAYEIILKYESEEYILIVEIQHYWLDKNEKDRIPISYFDLREKYVEINKGEPFKISTVFSHINHNNAVTAYNHHHQKTETNKLIFIGEKTEYQENKKVAEKRAERVAERQNKKHQKKTEGRKTKKNQSIKKRKSEEKYNIESGDDDWYDGNYSKKEASKYMKKEQKEE